MQARLCADTMPQLDARWIIAETSCEISRCSPATSAKVWYAPNIPIDENVKRNRPSSPWNISKTIVASDIQKRQMIYPTELFKCKIHRDKVYLSKMQLGIGFKILYATSCKTEQNRDIWVVSSSTF